MKVELHLIQNFAPACLNRDDTNTPKDCEFGGHRRARISSQCTKRAIRRSFREERLLPQENLAVRTRRLVEELVKRLKSRGKAEEDARRVVEVALKGVGFGLDSEAKTEYLLFLGDAEIGAAAELCASHWDELARIASAERPDEVGAREQKKLGKAAVPDELKKALLQVLDGGKAADLALFGRMLADMPDKNLDAACQVAHAISTNRVAMEMDFYTAVDDLQPEAETGAGMMGFTGYNSSCFYRYSLVDLGQLAENLGGDKDLALRTLEAFMRASVFAIPTGKQNSMAAHNPPEAILAVVRDKGAPVSLANAFVTPARPSGDRSLAQASIEAMDSYWATLTAVYGEDGVKARPICLVGQADLKALAGQKVETFHDLLARVKEAVQSGEWAP